MGAQDATTVLAEVAVEPAVAGAEHAEIVEAAIDALGQGDVLVQRGPMSTVVQGPLHEVLRLVAEAHETARRRSERVVTELRLESTRDGSGFAHRLSGQPPEFRAAVP
jgi:uncharacterized protein YqgV (UPF0045/DUF77 family)